MSLIKVDYRERRIITELNCICDSQRETTDVLISEESLPVGDFIIHFDSLDQLIIERKTKSDLISSVLDGRFREQKERLLSSGINILYILENCPEHLQSDKMDSIYLGSYINLLFKHHIKVIYSSSCQQTAQILLSLSKKISSGDLNTPSPKSSGKDICVVSKGNKIKDNLFAYQLSLVNGISFNMALSITSFYPTPHSLLKSFESSSSPDDLLSDIVLTHVGKGTKKLGKALSKRVYLAFCGPLL